MFCNEHVLEKLKFELVEYYVSSVIEREFKS